MKFAEPLASQRLSFLLEKAASREAKMWKVYVPKPSSLDTDIAPAQRDEVVRWLSGLHHRLQLYPETLVLAISILDRFLASIKARPKYLRCIAIACFFLAAKTSEEDERVPSLQDLISCSDCGCSQPEVLRMEKIILDKLDWDLHTATPLHFLHIFHAMVLCCRSQLLESALGVNRSQHLALLTQRLFHCLANHKLLQVRGSMLALALITLELETCCPDWLVLTIDLLKKAQIDSSELIHCRELVARSLSTLKASLPPNTVYIYQPLHSQTPAQPQPLDLASYRYTQGTTAGSSSRDQPLCATALPQTLAGVEGSLLQPCPALLAPPRPHHHHHHHHLQQVTLRCKASAKRKVEEMEVDEFFDGIKRLYNEDGSSSSATTTTTTTTQEGGTTAGVLVGGECGIPGLGGCSVLLSRQEGSTSPCPPLQPVSAS